MAGKQVLLLMVMCWSCGAAETSSDDSAQGTEGLTMAEVSPHRIRGQYSSSGGGITFAVDIGDGHHSLSVTTQQGGRILTSKQHRLGGETTPLGISLFQHRFLMSSDGSHMSHKEYLVPTHLHGYYEPTLKRAEIFRYLRKHLDDGERANKTRSTAIGQLLASKEAPLVVQAAKALGERGLRGSDSPAAMRFYLLAMHVQSLLDRTRVSEEADENSLERIVRDTESRAVGRQSHQSCSSCPPGKCPRGAECTGLCGAMCNCWEWVCGNCCLNRMCWDHDEYCSSRGFLSWCCLGIITNGLDADCDQPYICRG